MDIGDGGGGGVKWVCDVRELCATAAVEKEIEKTPPPTTTTTVTITSDALVRTRSLAGHRASSG